MHHFFCQKTRKDNADAPRYSFLNGQSKHACVYDGENDKNSDS